MRLGQRTKGAIKLDLCGGEAPYGHGYLNVDVRAVPGVAIVADLRHLPFRDDAIADIFSCGTLEHFSLAEAEAVLREMHRILKPGATLALGVPDLGAIARAYAEGTMDFALANQYLYGAQENPFDYHKCAFDFPSLAATLERAGLVNIRHVPYDMPFHIPAYMLMLVSQKRGRGWRALAQGVRSRLTRVGGRLLALSMWARR